MKLARRLPLLLTAGLALTVVPAAAADETFTQTVPAGGTLSTGSAVSAGDPVQLTLTASEPGTITIVKRTSVTRPAPEGAAEEDRSKPSYLGPRFEVSGTATIARTEILVDADSLPPSGYANPQDGRFATLLLNCTIPGHSIGSCGSGRFYRAGATGGVGPDGNLHGELPALQIGAEGAIIDFGVAGFQAAVGGIDRGDRDTLGVLLRENGFPGHFACTLRCTVSPRVVVSGRVQRALGLDSPVVAAATLKGTPTKRGGINQFLTYELPLKSGVESALRRKHIGQIGFRFTIRYNGPDGATDAETDGRGHTVRYDTYSSFASRFDVGCRFRGISGDELTYLIKGSRCPNVGRDLPGPPDWQ